MAIVVGLHLRLGLVTTRLAELPVVGFPDATACGSRTEVSVPCLFAPVGLVVDAWRPWRPGRATPRPSCRGRSRGSG